MAPAANAEMRAKRNAAFWGRGKQPFHAAPHEFLFALDGLHRNLFAGQDEGHEDSLSVVVCQTIPAVHEFFDAHVHDKRNLSQANKKRGRFRSHTM